MTVNPRILQAMFLLSFLRLSAAAHAEDRQIVLRDFVDQAWTNELLTFSFSAPENACHPDSVSLVGPRGNPVPVQLSEVTYWPGTQWVRAARLSFIAHLEPLATDVYTVRYDDKSVPCDAPATDLMVLSGENQAEIVTGQFGARLLLGERIYAEPVSASEVPGPVLEMRLADGTWFGGSAMYGGERIAAYTARLTDAGPVFARAAIRYTYENGNTLDLSMRLAAGDNTLRLETEAAQDQPQDGFTLGLSRGLPPLVFLVQDERRRDRDVFKGPVHPRSRAAWAEIPLQNYTADKPHPENLVTQLSPWEDWFGTFTQTRIRLRMEHTERELQIRSLDPGAWVEPRKIEEIFSPKMDPDPRSGLWVGWQQKCMPLLRETSGEIVLQVNAARGVRKWTLSECRSMHGVASLDQNCYQPENEFPPETRPTIGVRLNEVKDYVLDWPQRAGSRPLLFISREDLEALWNDRQAEPGVFEELLSRGSVKSADRIHHTPDFGYQTALGAYLVSGGAPEVAEQTLLLDRFRQSLRHHLWGAQFTVTGIPAATYYDALIDTPLISEAERPVLRSRMAYFLYRLTDPSVWSAERGYASGNQNMTVVWELSRGIAACAIPDHPMAHAWYEKSRRIMEHLLTHMVGPAGEWPEAMGQHGRASVNMIVAFAVASTNSGLHDYVNDARVQRLVLHWAKMLTPRDPRPRGQHQFAAPGRRYFPAMGRDAIGTAGGTCGVMARMTRHSDPAYAAQLQWAWLEEGANDRLRPLGGFSYVSCDRRLPARTPAWTSEVFPYVGVMLRHGLGSADEHQVLLYSGDHEAAFYPNHTGSFPGIFAYGTPVAGSFPGMYAYQERFLTSQVELAAERGTLEERSAVAGHHGSPTRAHSWSWPKGQTARFGERGGCANVSAFSTLPRQDYAAVDVARHHPRSRNQEWRTDLPDWPSAPVAGIPPVDWRRQVLFLKDDDPAKTAYLLIRDSIKGNQPTMWQMWTVSETLDTPERVRDVAAVLDDKPGYRILPARELFGNRFTAIGQLGVDVEYYIASPTDMPRHTLRWGTDMIDWANKLAQPEYQDLLHLQMPGDGAYFVAFYPRRRDWPAPTFSHFGNGLIIKVDGEWGTDYGFLSALPGEAAGEGASFQGTAASVQNRSSGRVLSLGAAGVVRYRDYGLAAGFPSALRVGENTLTVEFPKGIHPPAFETLQPFPGGTIIFTAPGEWVLPEPLPDTVLLKTADEWQLQVPAGCESVSLIR